MRIGRCLPVAIFITLFLCAAGSRASAQDYKAYQNYDFVAGDRIVFDDDFSGDKDGEFPAHWRLLAGQAVVNKVQGAPTFALIDGNYVKVEPRVTTKNYLGDVFTIEADFMQKESSQLLIFLHSGDDDRIIHVSSDVSTEGLDHDLSATNKAEEDSFDGKWHHFALVFNKGQVKLYEDQYRVLVVPDFGDFKPESVTFGGASDADNPLLVRNVRVAAGGGSNLIDALTRNGKIVTHGILFDVNSSAVKPQSMGTVSELVTMLKANAAVKVEIGGHTDSDGDAAKNLTLSQQRADAVKKLLVDQGVDAGRITTKGYGATKPIDKNDTPEGKANNRRVELTKM
jgi:OmpA-OmpF porin, OOP family